MTGGDSELRGWLEQLDADFAPGDEVGALASAAFLAARRVNLDEDELRGALRRALLLLATGGDPRRGLELDSRAVMALADDLDAPGPRAELAAALLDLR